MKFSNLKTAASVFLRFRLSKMLLSFSWSGYLHEIGWFNSLIQKKPVDKNNQPIPWVTYSFIEFIKGRLSNELVVLEFGSGNSTLFYSRFVKHLYAVEHEVNWFNEMKSKVGANVQLSYVQLKSDGEYARFSSQIDRRLDLIIVDGRDRVNCIKNSVGSLTENGVIVLDDSEREEYREGIAFLENHSFKRLDFWGIAPGIFFNKCTSVFYRAQNCLNI
jgi:hypothetical protein